MPRKPREDGRNAGTVAKNKYNTEKYERVSVNVFAGQKDVLKKYIDENGETVNTLINRLLAKEIDGFVPIIKK